MKKIEKDLIDQEEFEDYMNSVSNHGLSMASGKFKSVKRALKRGHITPRGTIIPKRPFNNRPNKSKRKGIHSRTMNEIQKEIYEQYRQYRNRAFI